MNKDTFLQLNDNECQAMLGAIVDLDVDVALFTDTEGLLQRAREHIKDGYEFKWLIETATISKLMEYSPSAGDETEFRVIINNSMPQSYLFQKARQKCFTALGKTEHGGEGGGALHEHRLGILWWMSQDANVSLALDVSAKEALDLEFRRERVPHTSTDAKALEFECWRRSHWDLTIMMRSAKGGKGCCVKIIIID
jgi:hypothetical protein